MPEVVTRQTDDLKLREGLKHMFSLVSQSLSLSALGGPDLFDEMEDEVVDRFIDGLRHNGYDIVQTDYAPQA
jgi:hypothetical protein